MKAYISALIDVSTPAETSKLTKNLIKDFSNTLKTPTSSINLKELNALIFLAADKPVEKPLNPTILEELQNTIHQRLQ
ncbi:MAG: hypothetical protein JSV20_04685, partial [Candidatus Bathyarchaeota archaeon]